MPPPQAVHTTNAKVGVHTRLTDEVEAWKIHHTLVMVRQMGAPWIVEYFPWPYIEPSPGRYDWAHSDMVIAHARNQGLTVIARLGMVPAWARPAPSEQETTLTHLDAENYDAFANFVADFAARYRGQVNHLIIWNEPNLSLEWGDRPVDPEAYVALLRAVYPAAHAANPDIIILAGALAPTLEPAGSPIGMDDLHYLRAMYAAGAKPYFDALAAHAYGHGRPPTMPPAPDVLNFRRVELLRAIMADFGDDAKPIYITEAGWNDDPRWVEAVSPSLRTAYTLMAYNWARTQWPWCPVVAMWMFRLPVPPQGHEAGYLFVTTDFQARPIYRAVQAYTGNLGEAQ